MEENRDIESKVKQVRLEENLGKQGFRIGTKTFRANYKSLQNKWINTWRITKATLAEIENVVQGFSGTNIALTTTQKTFRKSLEATKKQDNKNKLEPNIWIMLRKNTKNH